MLDIHRLKIFLKLAELKSFSLAARATYLTQPTVSQHMAALENYLGLTLFDRMGKEVRLTQAGDVLYRYAKQITCMTEEALQALELLKGKKSGYIVIGASTIPGEYILPAIIGHFKNLYPEIKIALKIGDTETITDDLLSHRIELGIVGAKLKNSKLKFSRYTQEELIVIVPPGHRWWNKASIEVKELLDEPFIMRERGSGTRISMERMFQLAGVLPEKLNIVAEVGSTTAVKQAVKANAGISIISELAVEEELRLKILKKTGIKNMQFIRTFYIVQDKKRTPSPLCKAFLGFLSKQK